jgi:hypothetical protein
VAPPKPLPSVIVTSAPGATRVALGISVARGSIVKDSADEVPPPGAGVDTLTSAVPTLATSAAAIEATSRPALTTVVGRGDPFHRATEKRVEAAAVDRQRKRRVARTRAGRRERRDGWNGLATCASRASASNRRRRGTVVMPEARVSATGKPVRANASRIV